MEELKLNERGAQIGEKVRSHMESLKSRCSVIADVRGLGAMIGIELCHGGDPRRPAGELVKRVTELCREQSLLVLPASVFGNVLRILSPLVITDEELDRGLNIMEAAILKAVEEAKI